MKKKITEVEVKFSRPQYFSFINGTHIPILKPRESSQTSITRILILLLLCKQVCRGMVMGIVYSSSGSLNGAKVFANSKFSTKMTDKKLPITYRNLLPGRCEVPCYIISDKLIL